MAANKRVTTIGYPASADLSSNQFRIVNIDGNGQLAALANGNTPPLGVLLNKPNAAGREGEVAIEGSDVKLEAGAVLNEGDLVVPVAGGRGSAINGTASGTTWVVGICTQPASGSAAIAGVLVRPYFHVRP